MSKKQICQRETHLTNGDTAGRELEQTLTVDDSFLPTAAELQSYKEIDPKIIDLLCDMSKSEQEFRHNNAREEMERLKMSDKRQYRTNIWGMFFALLALLAMMGVVAYALYAGKNWIAAIIGGFTIVAVLSVFVKAPTKDA